MAKEYGAQHMGDVIVASGARKETLDGARGRRLGSRCHEHAS